MSITNNNQALQILRGTRAGIIENSDILLLAGQPIYNIDDNYLTIGNNNGKKVNALPISVREFKGYFADKDSISEVNPTSAFSIKQYGDDKLRVFSNKKVLIDSEDEITLQASNKINILAPNVIISGMSNNNPDPNSLAAIVTKVNNNESNIAMLTQFKTGAETRFSTIEATANADRADLNALAGRVSTNESSISGLRTEVSAESIRSKLTSEWNRISDLETSQATLSETINTVDADGKAIAGQIVSLIGDFEFLPNIVWNPNSTADKDVSKIYKALKTIGGSIYYYYYYKDGKWNETDNPVIAGCKVSSAGIVTAINQLGESETKINANNINLEGYVTITSLNTPGATEIDGGNIKTNTLTLTSNNVTDFDTQTTTITNRELKTTDVLAQNLQVEAANILNLTTESILVKGSSDDENLSDYLEREVQKILIGTEINYGKNKDTASATGIATWYPSIAEVPELAYDEYLWQKIRKEYSNRSIDETFLCLGSDRGIIYLLIESSTGTFMLNGEENVMLSAKAIENGKDITSEFPDNAFSWIKYDMHGQNTSWTATGKLIQVKSDDIIKKAVFNCELNIDERGNV